MADVVLSTVDLDVFGGATTLDVSVDFGQSGERGSRIWVGSGNPTIFLENEDTKLYDLYINTATQDQYYGWLYQYVLEIGVPTWTRVLQLNPSQYSSIESVSFTGGAATIDIPVNKLTGTTVTNPSKFIIRYNIANLNPVSSGFSVAIVSSNIRITLSAVEYAGGSWTNLSGNKNVHLFISYKA